MAVLTDPNRVACWEEFMRENKIALASALSKADLRTFINDADAWANSNATNFNNALSDPAKSNLTQKQKALGLMIVIARRWLVEP